MWLWAESSPASWVSLNRIQTNTLKCLRAVNNRLEINYAFIDGTFKIKLRYIQNQVWGFIGVSIEALTYAYILLSLLNPMTLSNRQSADTSMLLSQPII